MNGYYVKNPGSEIDVTLDWEGRYLGEGETISSDLGWSVHPSAAGGVTVAATSHTALTTTAQLLGGRPGDVYLVTSVVLTDQGREIHRATTVRVANI